MATKKRGTPKVPKRGKSASRTSTSDDGPTVKFKGGYCLGVACGDVGLDAAGAAAALKVPAVHMAFMFAGTMPLPHPAVTDYRALHAVLSFIVDIDLDLLLSWADDDRRARDS